MARRLTVLLAVLVGGLLVLWLSRGGRDERVHAPEVPTSDAPVRRASDLTISSDAGPATEVREAVSATDVPKGPEEESRPSQVKSEAVLVVHAVAKQSLVPLPRVRMSVLRAAPASGSSKFVEGTRGSMTTSPHTDVDGVAEFDLPAGIDLQLTVRGEDENVGMERREIDALAAGERRDVTVELATGDDLVYFGRVLSREDRSPVAGASVQLVHVENWFSRVGSRSVPEHSVEAVVHEQATGPDGLFELSLSTWKAQDIRVQAPGFGLVFIRAGQGHDVPERAELVLLSRAATLRARLVDVGGAAIADGGVSLSTEPYALAQSDHYGFYLPSTREVRWKAVTDSTGLCIVADLPPNVPIHVEVSLSGHESKNDLPSLSLTPGEVREVEWTVGSGCRIEGAATDQSGQVVAHQTIWLQRADYDAPRFFEKYHGGEVVLEATTDGDGRFLFDAVTPGRWWIGPAALREQWDDPDPRGIAPAAQVVEVLDGSPRQEVPLSVHRGLYIRGHVLDPGGAAAPETFVLGHSEAGWGLSTKAGSDGAFALGPLVPGRYSLTANGQPHADSETLTADAGDDDVVLRLRSGGSLKGTVVDGTTRNGSEARLTIVLDDGSTGLMTTSTERDGSFHVGGLVPGSYSLFASAGGQRIGALRGIAVQGGADATGLVVALVPGAQLRVKYAGTEGFMSYRIVSEGMPIHDDGVAAGSSAESLVPAGHLLVAVVWLDKEEQKEIDLAVGDDKEIVFGP